MLFLNEVFCKCPSAANVGLVGHCLQGLVLQCEAGCRANTIYRVYVHARNTCLPYAVHSQTIESWLHLGDHYAPGICSDATAWMVTTRMQHRGCYISASAMCSYDMVGLLAAVDIDGQTGHMICGPLQLYSSLLCSSQSPLVYLFPFWLYARSCCYLLSRIEPNVALDQFMIAECPHVKASTKVWTENGVQMCEICRGLAGR